MITNAKILFIGPVYRGGTCYDRMRVMREMGLEITIFDTTPYLNDGIKIARSLRHRTKTGLNIIRLNRDLLSVAGKSYGITHIWFSKAVFIWPETLKKIRKITAAILIHYTPDAQIIWQRSRHFIKSIPLYDIVFTTKPFELDLYRELGAQRVYLTYQAYDKNRFYPREPSEHDFIKYKADITFIGLYEKYRADCIRAIVDSGVKVKVWGEYWGRYAKWHPWARNVVMGKSVICEQYCLALSSAKICLGLLSKFMPESTTTRSFEIPACGTFMLAERTKEHMKLFEEGKEAEYFSSKKELVQKIHYYLEHPQKRKDIAAAGRQRCVNSGYSFQDRLKDILEKVQEIR
ncbi:MAG: glycosyltransferase [Bacteroidetes bacterium]|nr:glycosyltransferase [Bacteroidota bacterium]